MNIDYVTQSDSRLSMGFMWTLAVSMAAIAITYGPAFDENGLLPDWKERSVLGFILINGLLVAPTYRIITIVDAETQTIFILHRLLYIVPIWRRSIRFQNVVAIDCKKFGHEDYGNVLTVAIRTHFCTRSIMFRHDAKNFPKYINQARDIAKMVGVAVSPTEPGTNNPMDRSGGPTAS